MSMACRDPFGPGGPLEPTIVASSDTVAVGDSVMVVFTLRNATPYARRIRSTAGCLYHLETLRGEEFVSWEGTDYLCTSAITYFTILPGDSLHYVHTLVAAERGAAVNRPEGALRPDTYRIRARMNADLPDVEVRVTVVRPVGAT
jgi:hypothetical protein